MTYMKQLKRSTANWNKLEDKRLGLIIALNEQIENHANGDLLLSGLQILSINKFSAKELSDFLESFKYNNTPVNNNLKLNKIIHQFKKESPATNYFLSCIRNWYNFSNEMFQDKNVSVKEVKFHLEDTDKNDYFKLVVVFTYKDVEVTAKFVHKHKIVLKNLELSFDDSNSKNYGDLYKFLSRFPR